MNAGVDPGPDRCDGQHGLKLVRRVPLAARALLLVLTAFGAVVTGPDARAQTTTQSATGRITGYIPAANGAEQLMFIQLDGGTPSTGCNTTGRLVLSSASPHFKASQAAIVAALLSQSSVTVFYTNACTRWGNAFDMNYLCVGSIPC